jgi:signal transduction histidine kinase
MFYRDRKIVLKKAAILGLITGLVGLVVALLPLGMELEERIGLSWLFNLRGERPVPPEVVIVSLDKESIDRLHLPEDTSKWPRSVHAELISKLSKQNPAVIAFDMSFKDPTEEDPIFSRAIQAAGNVVLVEVIERDLPSAADLKDSVLEGINIQRVVPPAPLLAQEAAELAVFPLPKVPVRVSQYWQYKDGNPNLPTLPVVALQIFSQKGHRMDQLSKRLVAYREEESAYLNFYGPPQTITTIPYHKILNSTEIVSVDGRAVSFAGKAVFIGLSEKTPNRQKDGFYTVFSQSDGLDISGVEIAATAFANLLEDRAVYPLFSWAWLLILLAWGMLIGTVYASLSLVPAVLFGVGLSLLYLGIAFLQFQWADLWSPLVVPILFQTPAAVFGAVLSHYFEARERDRLKSEAVLHLSHEIRSPLASTKGYLDNLRDGIVGDLTEGQERYITRMLSNMERLNRMVQDQLNLSQIESGKLTVSFVPLSLKDLLSERIETFRPVFSRKNIQVLLSVLEGTSVISGDRDRMDQVFTNLLDNAIKFTPSGGSITVTCRQNEKWIETSIQDTGIGIAAKEQAKIFNRLHQVQTGQPKQGKGVGLGLFIVKQLVELQGGTIRVQSPPAPAQGSEFIVAFPFCSLPNSPASPL